MVSADLRLKGEKNPAELILYQSVCRGQAYEQPDPVRLDQLARDAAEEEVSTGVRDALDNPVVQ